MKKNSRYKIGIIGCGTIGSSLAGYVTRHLDNDAELVYLCDHHREKAEHLKKRLPGKIRIVLEDELIQGSDLIVETASMACSAKIAQKALRKNKRVLIMSVGGLILDPGLSKWLEQSSGSLWVPSGAVAGIDGLQAACLDNIRRVKLVTRKPPRGLAGAPFFLKHPFPQLRGNEEKLVFRGTACEAVKWFPQNINVGAVVSLGGCGTQKTTVEIWTSKRYRRNEHELIAAGAFGEMRAVTRNKPSVENPKTSRLAVLSACAALKKICSRIKVGT
ncbi:MAG: hypothetical protein A2Z83_07340 [Omnitrophica bacterium GWA2_52_8]|nr:MAG: hypothetical protein A2Z83_07340 [Omnitrophica bacterium GWA2_52_8]